MKLVGEVCVCVVTLSIPPSLLTSHLTLKLTFKNGAHVLQLCGVVETVLFLSAQVPDPGQAQVLGLAQVPGLAGFGVKVALIRILFKFVSKQAQNAVNFWNFPWVEPEPYPELPSNFGSGSTSNRLLPAPQNCCTL